MFTPIYSIFCKINSYLCYFDVVISLVNPKSSDYLCFVINMAFLKFPNFMQIKLRKAHKALDKEVGKLYDKNGFKAPLDRVKHLFELYQLRLNT